MDRFEMFKDSCDSWIYCLRHCLVSNQEHRCPFDRFKRTFQHCGWRVITLSWFQLTTVVCSVTTTYVIIRAIHLGDQMPSCLFASQSYLIGNDLKPISLRMVDQLPNFIFLTLEFVSYIYYI